jgi:hypothetical protein
MPKTTLQSIISTSGSDDLAPLAANDTFSRQVNVELAARDAATLASEAAVARTEEVSSAVSLFSTATRAIRAVSKRFPETAKFMDEALKQTQLAMGAVSYNPQPLPGEPVPTPAPTTPAPAKPLPTANATGATPQPPAPPAPPAPPSAK